MIIAHLPDQYASEATVGSPFKLCDAVLLIYSDGTPEGGDGVAVGADSGLVRRVRTCSP